jgi:hypothetical protein
LLPLCRLPLHAGCEVLQAWLVLLTVTTIIVTVCPLCDVSTWLFTWLSTWLPTQLLRSLIKVRVAFWLHVLLHAGMQLHDTQQMYGMNDSVYAAYCMHLQYRHNTAMQDVLRQNCSQAATPKVQH